MGVNILNTIQTKDFCIITGTDMVHVNKAYAIQFEDLETLYSCKTSKMVALCAKCAL